MPKKILIIIAAVFNLTTVFAANTMRINVPVTYMYEQPSTSAKLASQTFLSYSLNSYYNYTLFAVFESVEPGAASSSKMTEPLGGIDIVQKIPRVRVEMIPSGVVFSTVGLILLGH